MKTTAKIFAIGLAMIVAAGMNNLYAQKNLRQGHPQENKARSVSYTVWVKTAGNIKDLGAEYKVVMTDENGTLVATPQNFVAGQALYHFSEGGTVRGTRVAKMVSNSSFETNFSGFYACTKTGVFYGGVSYLFVIQAIGESSQARVDKQ